MLRRNTTSDKYVKEMVEDNPAVQVVESKGDNSLSSSVVVRYDGIRRSTRKSSSRYAWRSEQRDVTDSLGLQDSSQNSAGATDKGTPTNKFSPENKINKKDKICSPKTRKTKRIDLTSKSSSDSQITTRGTGIVKYKQSSEKCNIKTHNNKERQLSGKITKRKSDISKNVPNTSKKSKKTETSLHPICALGKSLTTVKQSMSISLMSEGKNPELSSTGHEHDESKSLPSTGTTQIAGEIFSSPETVTQQTQKMVMSCGVSLLSDSLRKRKSSSRSKGISILLSTDSSEVCSTLDSSRRKFSKTSIPKKNINTSTSSFKDISPLNCKCVEKIHCTCISSSSPYTSLPACVLDMEDETTKESISATESEVGVTKELSPLTPAVISSPRFDEFPVDIHPSKPIKISSYQSNHEPETSNISPNIGTGQDMLSSIETQTFIEDNDGRSKYKTKLKHGIMSEMRSVGNRGESEVVEKEVEVMSEMRSNGNRGESEGLDEVMSKTRRRIGNRGESEGVDKEVEVISEMRRIGNRSECVDVGKEVQTLSIEGDEKMLTTGLGLEKEVQTSEEMFLSGSPHRVMVDKVFGHVSALINDEFVKSADVNAFIQGVLPRLTGIKCISSQDHLTINGSLLAVNKAWNLLNKMAEAIPDEEMSFEVDVQPDHDYNQSTKSLKIMWTEPNGNCYELPCENVSDGKYVAKKPTKSAVVPTQAKGISHLPGSKKIFSELNKGSNSELSGIKGDNCIVHSKHDFIMLKMNESGSEMCDDRALQCCDQSNSKSSITDQSYSKSCVTDHSDSKSSIIHQSYSNSSVNDQSDSKSFIADQSQSSITDQSGEVLLDTVADGVVYVKGFEGLPNVAIEEDDTNTANRQVIDFAECKETLERDTKLVSDLTDTEQNVEVGKEKLVMITGPFGDKQCIVLTVDSTVKEDVDTDLEIDSSNRNVDGHFCKEQFDSIADMEHPKTSHFNRVQDAGKVTEGSTIDGNIEFDCNIEISESYSDSLETDGHNGCIRTSKIFSSDVSRVRNVQPEIKCSKCSAVFSQIKHLKQHLHDSHLMKRHNCGVCGKGFNEKRYLHAHLNRHFGIKKHVCMICGWKFFERHKLKLHMETHKAVDKRRLPYRCLICLHQFHNRATWSDHMNTHTGAKPFACSTCPAKFAHRIGLKRHWLVHAKETPFKCVYCEKGFKLKTKLQDHLTVHTGRGRHSCQICQKVFTASASLKRHVYTAHWENRPSSSGTEETVFMCWKCGAMFPSLKETEEHTSRPCVSQVKLEVEDPTTSEISSLTDTTIVIQQTEQSDDASTDAQLQSLLSSLQNREDGISGPCLEKSTLDEVEQMKLAASTLADLYSYAQEIKKEKE